MKLTVENCCDALPEAEGLLWSPRGYASLSGPMLSLYREIDSFLLSLAELVQAQEARFPALIAAEDLERISYLQSFGHLATMPAAYDPATGNATAVQSELLTPAACYHVYAALKNSNLNRSIVYTTKSDCFRRESHYKPLQRQWCFAMREIVCVGTRDDVDAFVTRFRSLLGNLFSRAVLPIKFEHATDPFFNPADPKLIMQKIDPVKQEMMFDGLAIGSINQHRTTFGEAFNISIHGESAYSACVAFGLERWMYCLLSHYGSKGPFTIFDLEGILE